MSDHDIGLALKLKTEQAEAAVKKFTSSTIKSLNSIGKASKDLFGGKWGLLGGAITGAAIYETIRKVGEFDDKIRRLAIDAGMSTAEMLTMKNQILDTGMKTGVATEELVGMSKAAYDSSKNIKFVKDEMGFMAKVAQASGASGEEVGDMLGELQRETGLTGTAFEDLVDKLGRFGATKGAKMSLKQFLPQAGDLLKTAKFLAKTGAIKDVGRVLIEGEFTGAPQAVAQAYLTMHGKGNLVLIKKLGLKQGFTLVDAIQSVFAKIPKDKQTAAFEMLLGRRNVKNLEPLIDDVTKLAEAEKEASSINFLGRADTQSKSFSAAMNRIDSAFLTIADTGLAPVIDQVSQALEKMNPEDIRSLGEAFKFLTTFITTAAQGYMNLFATLDQGLDIFGRWQKITDDNAAKQKQLEDQANFIKEKKSGRAKFVAAPSSDSHVPTNVESGTSAAEMFGMTGQKLGESLFGGGIQTVTNVYVDGKNIPSTSKTTVGSKGKQGLPGK